MKTKEELFLNHLQNEIDFYEIWYNENLEIMKNTQDTYAYQQAKENIRKDRAILVELKELKEIFTKLF